MPLYVRRLPAQNTAIVDPKSLPANQSLYNPSRAGNDLYIRATIYTRTNELNHALFYNVETKVTKEVKSPYHLLKKTVNLFQGIEDLRICRYNERVWFSATATHASDDMTNVLIIGYMNEYVSEVEFLQVVDIGSLPVKNVCPFVWKDKLHLLDVFLSKIYLVVEEKDESGALKLFAVVAKEITRAPGISDTQYRGSTSPVHLHGNTWGCVVHDIIFNDNKILVTRLAYMHHWMEFDMDRGVTTFISSPFFLQHWGVEYISGIFLPTEATNMPVKDAVVLYYGIQDKAPMQAVTRLSDLRCGR